MSDGNEDWCKVWRKTDLRFQKWHEEFRKYAYAEINERQIYQNFLQMFNRITVVLRLKV